MAEVTLKNVSHRMITLDLNHPSAPRTRYTYQQRTLDRRSGKSGIRRQQLSMHGSLILLSGQSRNGLDPWVAELPSVKSLVKAKMLKVSGG